MLTEGQLGGYIRDLDFFVGGPSEAGGLRSGAPPAYGQKLTSAGQAGGIGDGKPEILRRLSAVNLNMPFGQVLVLDWGQ